MEKRRVIAIWLLFFSCAAMQGWSQNQSIRVDIKVARTVLKSSETLRIDTAIRNVGTLEEHFPVFTCSCIKGDLGKG